MSEHVYLQHKNQHLLNECVEKVQEYFHQPSGSAYLLIYKDTLVSAIKVDMI